MMLTNKEIAKWLQSLKSEIGKQNNRHLWNFEEAIDMAIDALNQTAWIPVVERKPDTNDEVLITLFWHDKYEVGSDFWTGTEWHIWGEKVIAWMPLPEPYKGGDNND